MQWIKLSHVITYAACFLFAACGSSGQNDDEVASIIDGSGAPVPDVAVTGAITGFGSVIVDGTHYQTDNAEVYINGELSSEDALSVGDFVTLLAVENETGDELDASVVYAESAVLGKVSGVNATEGTIDVLNQRVRISGDTVFDTTFEVSNISDITVGDTVEILGANTGAGSIYATRINKVDSATDILSGRVASLDESAQTFTLSGNLVDYSEATLGFSLADGKWISVVGKRNGLQDRFVAAAIRERKDKRPLAEGITSRLEGLVENVSQAGFEINGQVVSLQANTEYRDGSVFDLLNGAVVVVEGKIDSQGQLQARSIRFRDNNFITLEGVVEDINPVGLAPEDFGYDPFNWGTIAVDGETFIVNVYTRFVGRGPEFGFHGAWFGDLRLGDKVSVVAIGLPATGELLAWSVDIDRTNAFASKSNVKVQHLEDTKH